MAIINPELIYGHWWINNKMGSYDGLEFVKDGECIGTNFDFFIPKNWNLHDNNLIITMKLREKEKVIAVTYNIISISAEKMILSDVDEYLPTQDIWERIHMGDFTDEMYGRWNGENDSFLEIVPNNQFEVFVRTKYDDDEGNVIGDIRENGIQFEVNYEDEFITLVKDKLDTSKFCIQLKSGRKYWK